MTWPLLGIAVLFIVLGLAFHNDPSTFAKMGSRALGEDADRFVEEHRKGMYSPESIRFAGIVLVVAGIGGVLLFLALVLG